MMVTNTSGQNGVFNSPSQYGTQGVSQDSLVDWESLVSSLDGIPTLMDAVSSPSPGSVVGKFPRATSSSNMFEDFLEGPYKDKILPILISDDYDAYTYLMYSLVTSHSDAVTYSERVASAIKSIDSNHDRNKLRQAVLGLSVSSKKEMLRGANRMLVRFPHIITMFRNLASKHAKNSVVKILGV